MSRRTAPVLVCVLALAACAPDDPEVDDPAATAPEAPQTDDPTEPDGAPDGEDPEPDETEPDPTAADEPEEDTTASEDGHRAEVAELEFTTCEAATFTIEHPADWVVHDEGEVDACRVFHPEELEVVRGEDLHHAVRIYIDPVTLEDVTEGGLDEIVHREELTVDGRDAVLVERLAEGRAMLPEGERSYTYAVALDDGALVATTTTVGDTDHDRDRAVLDRMIGTLRVTDEG